MKPLTLWTFGDSILDCAAYNPLGHTPAELMLVNDDEVFPEWKGIDLMTMRGDDVSSIVQRAKDGATSHDLGKQTRRLRYLPNSENIALVAVGGNDLLTFMNPLINKRQKTRAALDSFFTHLTHGIENLRGMDKVLIANVYDPTFGDNANNIFNLPPKVLAQVALEWRKSMGEVNALLEGIAEEYGHTFVNLHEHFFFGEKSWYTNIVEPSLLGVSEVRRAFMKGLGIEST